MSSIFTAVREVLAPALNLSLVSAVEVFAGALLAGALLVLFKPLLRGVARALVLVVRPKLSKEQTLARRQMHNAEMLNSMLSAMDDPSHASELRAMASRA